LSPRRPNTSVCRNTGYAQWCTSKAGGQTRARSRRGAMGLTQTMPKT
jgi:hypothetical protein